MEKNPVFELSEESPPSDRNGRRDTPLMRSIQASQKKVSGRVLALAVVAVIAILVLGGLVALIVFRPSTSESSSDNQEIESLKQQLENLRQLVSRLDQHVNNTYSIQDATIRAFQSQAQIRREETNIYLQKLNDSVLDLQTDFRVTMQIFAENITDVLLNRLDEHINNTYTSNNMQDEAIKALQLQLNITRQISNEELKNQLQTYNETVVELQVELQNVLGDFQSSRIMFVENVTAIRQVMQELSTTQVNISHKIQYLENSVLQQPSIQVNTSESKCNV